MYKSNEQCTELLCMICVREFAGRMGRLQLPEAYKMKYYIVETFVWELLTGSGRVIVQLWL